MTAQDADGDPVTSYTGTVALTSNAFAGTVNATITTGGLVGEIEIMPTVAGTVDRTIDATDGSLATTNASGNFTVTAGDAAKFAVTQTGTTTPLLASYPAGTAFEVRVTAQDLYGNTVSGYGGTVHLTSTAFAVTVDARPCGGCGKRNRDNADHCRHGSHHHRDRPQHHHGVRCESPSR